MVVDTDENHVFGSHDGYLEDRPTESRIAAGAPFRISGRSPQVEIRVPLTVDAREAPRTRQTNARRPAAIATGLPQESGGVLLSHAENGAVPSALKGFTSVFGMGTGGSTSLSHQKSCLTPMKL